jgi:ParB family chromosome partitioning protein
VQEIPLEEIDLKNRMFQYRFSSNLGDLKHSLSLEGQKEPIDLTGSKPHRIVDGFRRVEALQALGWKTVKALVHKGITDEEAHSLAFIKNVFRKNLAPMDKANAIFQAKQRGKKPADLSEAFGLSEKQIKRYEALLNFSPDIQKLLEEEAISMGHAKVLSDHKIKDKNLEEWAKNVGENKLSEKQLKRELKKALGEKSPGRPKLYLKKEKNRIRVFPFIVGKDSPPAEKERVIKLFLEAVEMLKG